MKIIDRLFRRKPVPVAVEHFWVVRIGGEDARNLKKLYDYSLSGLQPTVSKYDYAKAMRDSLPKYLGVREGDTVHYHHTALAVFMSNSMQVYKASFTVEERAVLERGEVLSAIR